VALGNQVLVTGQNFGQVSGVALVDTTTNIPFSCPNFIVDWGTSIHLTVPLSVPVGFYDVVLVTIYGVYSVNNAGAVNVIPSGVPNFPPGPVYPPTGTTSVAVLQRLRYELGDYAESFTDAVEGDGVSTRIEVSGSAINTASLVVTSVAADATRTTLVAGTDYLLLDTEGVINLVAPTPVGATLYIAGIRYQFFTDTELTMFLQSALYKHFHNSTTRTIIRDPVTGFVTYTTTLEDLNSIPPVEIHPVAILACIEALWVLASDATYDIDVTTAEGTSLPRQERYRAMMQMVAAQQMRYDDLCAQLNVGLKRIEMFTLRRVSRSTGRLVPIFQPQEIDEWGPPIRVFPPVDGELTGTGTAQRWMVGNNYPPADQP
jgi:hypothetical protein